jgi:hypothetical protein
MDESGKTNVGSPHVPGDAQSNPRTGSFYLHTDPFTVMAVILLATVVLVTPALPLISWIRALVRQM